MFFNTPEVDDADDFEVLADGDYRVAVIDSTYKPTKSGTGHYMAVAFQVMSGQYKDRRLFANFNIQNQSEVAQRIGRGQMKRFLAAVGVTQALTSENEFHKVVANKTLWVGVETEPDQNNKPRNVIRKFFDTPGGHSAHGQPAQARQAFGGAPKTPGLDDIPF